MSRYTEITAVTPKYAQSFGAQGRLNHELSPHLRLVHPQSGAPVVMFVLLCCRRRKFQPNDVNDQPDVEFPAVQVLVAQPAPRRTSSRTWVCTTASRLSCAPSAASRTCLLCREVAAQHDGAVCDRYPIDRAYNDVNQAVQQIRSDLPEGILEPQVVRVDFAGGPITYFAVEATDMTLEQLSWFVDNTVAKELLSVSGVARVRRSGGVDREIRVIHDPARMQSYGVTASQINQQLRQTNVNAAGGRTEIAGSEQAVRVLGNAGTAKQLGDYQLSLGNGRTIRLSDVATVTDGYAESAIWRRSRRQFCRSRSKGTGFVGRHRPRRSDAEAGRDQKNNPKSTSRSCSRAPNIPRNNIAARCWR